MAQTSDFQSIQTILQNKRQKKPTAYEWQELALRVIEELRIPGFKRSAVFKVCKEKPKNVVEHCLNETKELCETGQKWKYFFKVIASD